MSAITLVFCVGLLVCKAWSLSMLWGGLEDTFTSVWHSPQWTAILLGTLFLMIKCSLVLTVSLLALLWLFYKVTFMEISRGVWPGLLFPGCMIFVSSVVSSTGVQWRSSPFILVWALWSTSPPPLPQSHRSHTRQGRGGSEWPLLPLCMFFLPFLGVHTCVHDWWACQLHTCLP